MVMLLVLVTLCNVYMSCIGSPAGGISTVGVTVPGNLPPLSSIPGMPAFMPLTSIPGLSQNPGDCSALFSCL